MEFFSLTGTVDLAHMKKEESDFKLFGVDFCQGYLQRELLCLMPLKVYIPLSVSADTACDVIVSVATGYQQEPSDFNHTFASV